MAWKIQWNDMRKIKFCYSLSMSAFAKGELYLDKMLEYAIPFALLKKNLINKYS